MGGAARLVVVLLQLSCDGQPDLRSTPTAPSSPSVPPSVGSITVALVAVGSEYQTTAVAAFSDGSSREVTSEAQWSSSNAEVAAVSASGRVTPAAPGTTEIRL